MKYEVFLFNSKIILTYNFFSDILPNMQEKVNSFIVSSADWEIESDEQTALDAAISALILSFMKFGGKFSLSTVIMVTPKGDHIKNRLTSTEFFASSEILNRIGLKSTAEHFNNFTEFSNETRNT